MSLLTIITTVFGLTVFEIVSSIDNAVINAQVLGTMPKKAQKWFLVWGLLFAVFIMRGLLPWLIVYLTSPSLGPIGALTGTFRHGDGVQTGIEQSAPILQVGGGTFLLFLFLHWLFMEPKSFGLVGERFFVRQGVWFYAVVSIALTAIVWLALHADPLMALGAVVGSSAFFITNGFKENAEKEEKLLVSSRKSVVSKILYLEILDATFSIDGVLGAFAFTLSVPLILIGNGIGAVVLRQLTIGNIDRIKKYVYLQNGAMYAVFFLSLVLLLESFRVGVPEWIAPLTTVGSILYFFIKSRREIGK